MAKPVEEMTWSEALDDLAISASMKARCDVIRKHMAVLEGEIARLRALTDRRVITCVYCGIEYQNTATSQASHLYEHIKVCPKHPLSKALAEKVELERELAEAKVERDEKAWQIDDLRQYLLPIERAKHDKDRSTRMDSTEAAARGSIFVKNTLFSKGESIQC